MIEQHDDKTRRCPMLGHEISFAYCRQPGREIPCPRIQDCWWERFDIQGFLRAHYSAEEIAEMLRPRQPKVATLLEIIQKAQKGTGD